MRHRNVTLGQGGGGKIMESNAQRYLENIKWTINFAEKVSVIHLLD